MQVPFQTPPHGHLWPPPQNAAAWQHAQQQMHAQHQAQQMVHAQQQAQQMVQSMVGSMYMQQQMASMQVRSCRRPVSVTTENVK